MTQSSDTGGPFEPTPADIIGRYVAGELDRTETVAQLSAYPYLRSDLAGLSPGTPTDDSVVHVPGSWDDVEGALFDGEIDRELYDEVERAVVATGRQRWNLEQS